jgi:hypothetical protein
MRQPAKPYAFDKEYIEIVWADASANDPADTCRADPYVKYS